MASIIKANQLQDFGGNSIITSDGAGVVTPNATGIKNVPAFHAYLSSAQTVTDNTITKAQIDTEILDTDNCYDNSTNYRFTPTTAGKYFVYFAIACEADANVINDVSVYLYKNGVEYLEVRDNPVSSERGMDVGGSNIVDFNGTTDYVEVFGRINVDSNTPSFSSATKSTYFGAYRIIGA